MWDVIFDGETYREWARAGFWVRPPGGRDLNYYYKLSIDCTNNEAKYEAMVLSIHILKYFQAQRVMIHGYFELVIKQMTSEY